MKIFEYQGNSFAVLDGEVWVKLRNVTATSELSAPEPTKPRRGRRPGSKLNKTKPSMADTQKRIREYKPRRKHLGPEAEEIIKDEIRAGLGLTDACKKYEISVSTYYRLKNESESSAVEET